MAISKLSLEESIRNYDRENSRKESFESKSSYFLGIMSLFAGIWGNLITIIASNHPISLLMSIFIGLSILTIFFILRGAFYAIQVLKIQDYSYPIGEIDPNKLKKDLTLSEEKLTEELFYSYLSCFTNNNVKNNQKAENLKETEYYLLFALITSGISIFLIWGIIF